MIITNQILCGKAEESCESYEATIIFKNELIFFLPPQLVVLTDITGHVKQRYLNRSFAARHSGGKKLPCWIAKVALGKAKQRHT